MGGSGRRVTRACIGAMLAVIATGCGHGALPPLGYVSGRITLDGRPLAHAAVHFQPASGRPSMCLTDADGRYVMNYIRRIDGVCLGPATVHVSTLRYAEGIDPLTGKEAATVPERVPARYNAESTLSVDVKPGTNRFDFELLTTP